MSRYDKDCELSQLVFKLKINNTSRNKNKL